MWYLVFQDTVCKYNKIKYLVVFLNSKLHDDEDIDFI